MMRVLITGITGFIGSQLARELLARGSYEIYGLTRKDSFSSNRIEGVKYLEGDLMGYYGLELIEDAERFDAVIHLAALTPVRFSFDNPAEYARVNYMGTVKLVHALRPRPPGQLIYASTAEVYISKEIRDLHLEGDRIGGQSPYGISKAAAEVYVREVGWRSFKIPFTVMRPSNTHGRHFELPEEARGYLVEKAISMMLQGDEAKFDGQGDPVRSWMRWEDHVSAYIKVLEGGLTNLQDGGPGPPGVYNVGTNEAWSVYQVVRFIASELDQPLHRIRISWGNNPRPFDPPNLSVDATKLMRTGWRPQYKTEEGLRKTIEYWRAKALMGVK